MPDLPIESIIVVLCVACSGIVVTIAFIWYFLFKRSLTTVVMMLVSFFMNNDEPKVSPKVKERFNTDNEQPLGERTVIRAQDIPFEAHVPDIRAKESLASGGVQAQPTSDNMAQTASNAPSLNEGDDTDKNGETDAPPADPRGFRHKRLRPGDTPNTNQE